MPTPKGKKKRGDDRGVDVGVGSSTTSVGGGSLSGKGNRRGDRRKMGSRASKLDGASLEEQVRKTREALIEERQQELDTIVDNHDDLVRIFL